MSLRVFARRYTRANWLFNWIVLLIAALSLYPSLAGSAPSDALSPQPSSPRSRVVVGQDPAATEFFLPRMDHVRLLVQRGITNLTGTANPVQAWRSLVSTQDTVGIKVYSVPGPNSGTRPAVAAAVVEGLLSAGLPPKHIIVWDKHLSDLRLAGFFDFVKKYKIRVAASVDEGYDENAFYENALLGTPNFGDREFGAKGDGVGRKSYVTRLVSREMTKIINITPLLNHNEAGVCGSLYSLAMGSVDNTFRFEGDPNRLAVAVPEIYNLTNLADHVVLNVVDALICQYEGGQRGLLHYSTVLNQLRFSRDPVALDWLSLEELDRQRTDAKAPSIKPNKELLSNASLLELGISDPRRIQVDWFTSGKQASGP
jgi:hypothetical protein